MSENTVAVEGGVGRTVAPEVELLVLPVVPEELLEEATVEEDGEEEDEFVEDVAVELEDESVEDVEELLGVAELGLEADVVGDPELLCKSED